jgi:hypothetical protein
MAGNNAGRSARSAGHLPHRRSGKWHGGTKSPRMGMATTRQADHMPAECFTYLSAAAFAYGPWDSC